MLKRFIIGAPFGNYLHWQCATSTLGTYTLQYRGGFWWRLWRVLSTVRFYPGIGAWKNKLGLPNPGIGHLEKQKLDLSTKIVSISARNTEDWLVLLGKLRDMRPGAVELNVSCPNCPGEHDMTDYRQVFSIGAKLFGSNLIVKLPPVNYKAFVELALISGVVSFHCCNSLPTPGGGLSGKPLKLLSLEAIQHLRVTAIAKGIKLVHVIGGGGVSTWQDIMDYRTAGASSVAIASVLLFPWKWAALKSLGCRLCHEPWPPKPGPLKITLSP